jgi:hypothetical protein
MPDAFHQLLNERPKLARVNNNLRAAALTCIEHYPVGQAIIEKLEKNDDPALHMMGVRGLADQIKTQLESVIGEGDDGDKVDLEDEPTRTRRRGPTTKDKLDALTVKFNDLANKYNGVLHDVRQTGLAWRVDSGCVLSARRCTGTG